MCSIWDEMDELVHDFYDECREMNVTYNKLAVCKNKAQEGTLTLPVGIGGVPIRPGGIYYDTGREEKLTAWLVNESTVMDDFHGIHFAGEVTSEIPDKAVTCAERERIDELVSLRSIVNGSGNVLTAADVAELIADRLSELGVKEDCE